MCFSVSFSFNVQIRSKDIIRFWSQWDLPGCFSHKVVPTYPDIWTGWRLEQTRLSGMAATVSPIHAPPQCSLVIPLRLFYLESGQALRLLWHEWEEVLPLEAIRQGGSTTTLRSPCCEKPKPRRTVTWRCFSTAPSWAHSQHPLPALWRNHLGHPAQLSLRMTVTSANIKCKCVSNPQQELPGWSQSTHKTMI